MIASTSPSPPLPGRPYPISVIVGALNRLKPANDKFGHAADDESLRRVGEILTEAVSPPATSPESAGTTSLSCCG